MLEVGYGGGLTAGPPKSNNDGGKTAPADQSYGYQKGLGENGVQGGYSASGGGGGGYWGGTISTTDGHGWGGSGYIGGVTNFQDITAKSIPGNQEIKLLDGSTSIGNNGDGAARITMIGYVLTKVSEIDPMYAPGSQFSITFEVNTLMNANEESRIYRQENYTSETLVDTHQDNNKVYSYTDSFPLPKKSGYFDIVYTVSTKSGSNTSVNYKILINTIPKIKALNNISSKYKPNSAAFIDVLVEDDTFVNLMLAEESTKKSFKNTISSVV